MHTCRNEIHDSEIKFGHRTCPCLINLTRCKIDVVQKGGAPTKSSYIMHPRDHKSALWS